MFIELLWAIYWLIDWCFTARQHTMGQLVPFFFLSLFIFHCSLAYKINLSKLVNHLTSALFFHSHYIVLLDLLLLSPLVVLLSPLVIKLQTYLYFILLLLCGTVCRLIYTSLCLSRHSFAYIKLTLSLIFQDLFFLKILNTHLFHCFFLFSLYSPRPSQDWHLRYWPRIVASSQPYFTIIHSLFIHGNY